MDLTTSKYTESALDVFITIDVSELNRIVHKLENKSSTGEGITIEIMKNNCSSRYKNMLRTK